MAVRVRKLARELGRSPWDVLGLCHALGYTRYRSPEDMLPDNTVSKVRGAARRGVEPVPVAGRPAPQGPKPSRPAPQPSKKPSAQPEPDLMSSLVPGVVASRDPQRDSLGGGWSERSLAAERAAIDLDRSALADERSAFQDQRSALEARQVELQRASEQLATREAVLSQARDQLRAEQEALLQQAEALQRARAALDLRQSAQEERAQALAPPPPLPMLKDLLQARGLRGLDEQERAIGSLASKRLLRELLPHLRVEEASEVARLLERRLVLVEGEPPALSAGLVPVQVAPERSELPRASEVQRLLEKLGEQLMLHGLTRVALVGGRPAWQRLIHAGLDPRIELRFSPTAPRSRAEAEAELARVDVLILWGVPLLDEAAVAYEGGRALVIRADDQGLPGLVAAVLTALDSSA